MDMATLCCTSATSDIKTVRRRFEHEGISILTIFLPDYGKVIQKWLDLGHVGIDPSFPLKRKRGEVSPILFGGFLNRVFDRNTGVLLDRPDEQCVFALRQLTMSFGKVALPCTNAREKAAYQNYIECEKDVRRSDLELSRDDLYTFQIMSDLLFSELFTQVDRDVYYGNILPKHGPGVTVDATSSNGKYTTLTWTSRLSKVFPPDRYLIPNHHFIDVLDKVTVLEPDTEIPVKVISVPKTLKTPRIIAVEPTCMQYMQQGLLRSILEAYRRDNLLRKLIGFDDQTPNQELARQGSLDGETATLDLSDASDRVSNQLVRLMVSRWPHLRDAVDATRSRRAVMPDGTVVRLAKYASMGSALCFPFEAFVFTTLIFVGIQKSLRTPLTREDIKSLSGSVRVYGDDLIVPTRHVRTIVETLEHFGARVGLSKSFWTGQFRESCGKEYFNGHDVSITRVRQVLPSTIADATSVVSTVALRNLLYNKGLYGSVEFLDNLLRRVLKHYPIVGPDSPVLGRVSLTEKCTTGKVDMRTQAPLVKGYRVHARPPVDLLDGPGALLKCLLRLEYINTTSVNSDVPLYVPGTSPRLVSEVATHWAPPSGYAKGHLERSGRPKRVSIMLGWWPARS